MRQLPRFRNAYSYSQDAETCSCHDKDKSSSPSVLVSLGGMGDYGAGYYSADTPVNYTSGVTYSGNPSNLVSGVDNPFATCADGSPIPSGGVCGGASIGRTSSNSPLNALPAAASIIGTVAGVQAQQQAAAQRSAAQQAAVTQAAATQAQMAALLTPRNLLIFGGLAVLALTLGGRE